MNIIAIIPARSGSKGIPNKNILEINGKPLLSYPIVAAKKSKYIKKVFLTTDSQEYASIGKSFGAEVPWIRPSNLASDDAVRSDVILHALENLPHSDIFVYLEPTSPLTTANDIDHAIEHLLNHEYAKSCVSVAESFQHHPAYCIRFNSQELIAPYALKSFKQVPINRQELDKAYFFDGSLYISYTETFFQEKEFYHEKTSAVILGKDKELEIDTLEDIEKFKRIINE